VESVVSSSGGAEDVPSHKILIKNDQFVPSYLQVQRHDVVEWSVLPDAVEESQSSLYYHDSRSHVISFDNLNEESEVLTSKRTSTFKVRFQETGFFTYRCQIYTRMLGAIEVVERQGAPYPGRPVVKSVKDMCQFANKAAVAAPASTAQLQMADFQKRISYEQHHGRRATDYTNSSPHGQPQPQMPFSQQPFFTGFSNNSSCSSGLYFSQPNLTNYNTNYNCQSRNFQHYHGQPTAVNPQSQQLASYWQPWQPHGQPSNAPMCHPPGGGHQLSIGNCAVRMQTPGEAQRGQYMNYMN